jgi:DNA processing protein
MHMDDQVTEWIMLSLVPGLGARGAAQLAASLGSPAEVFAAPRALLAAQEISQEALYGLALPHLRPEAERIREKVQQLGLQLICLSDPNFPAVLKEIYDPPIVIYARGDSGSLARIGVAIVGTRRPTPYGISVAEELAMELASRGLLIVSGLARGIDTAAHRGALKAKGCTAAVLGSGVDVIYPPENRKVAQQILDQNGILISEFPLGSFPAPQNFPIRNRIISGLAFATVVVEAAEYSGSLITARMALEQNHDVYAIPGNVTSEKSRGPNQLIQQGAKLVLSWRDIVEELPLEVRREALKEPEKASEGELPLLAPEEQEVLCRLQMDLALHLDELCLRCLQAPQELQELLLNLELKGYVKQLPGKKFLRASGRIFAF